jgi:outer membrane protein assembly factor BamB
MTAFPVQDTPPPGFVPRRRVRVSGVITRLVLAFVAGLAVTLFVHGAGALIGEAGGSCGSHSGPCPSGTGLGFGLGMVVSIFTVPLTVRTLLRRPRWLALVAVLPIVGGVLLGQQVWASVHGPTVHALWSAPSDANPDLDTVGVWTDGATLARVRVDQVTGYVASTGGVAWTYPLTGQDVVCSVSRSVDAHLAVLGVAAGQDAPCDSVVVLDLRTGRPVWNHTLPAGDEPTDTVTNYVTIGSGTVTVALSDGLVGYDEQTGRQRWQQPLPADCGDAAIAADHGGLAESLDCDNSVDRIAALDPATGRPRWQADRTNPAGGDDSDPAQDSLVAANPVVVDEELAGPRHTEHLLAYDATGHLTASISTQVSTPDGPQQLDPSGRSFDAAPVRWVFLANGLLIATTDPDSSEHPYVTAFRLSDGRQVWQTQLAQELLAIGPAGNHLVALEKDDPSNAVQSIPLTGGAATNLGVMPDDDLTDPQLYAFGPNFALVNRTGDAPYSPVQMIGS